MNNTLHMLSPRIALPKSCEVVLVTLVNDAYAWYGMIGEPNLIPVMYVPKETNSEYGEYLWRGSNQRHSFRTQDILGWCSMKHVTIHVHNELVSSGSYLSM
jgi:hypothetical protein